jgi:uncharacterized protein YaaQ
MKMVTAVVQEEDCEALIQALLVAGFHATKVASTGGFLHRGNVTLLIGTEDGELDLLVDLIRRECHARTVGVKGGEVTVGGAVVFVQEISRYLRV